MSKTKSTSINQATKKLKELQTQQNNIVKEVVDGLKPLIKGSKFVKQIQWTQYTPYFNDGDTCEFSVHDLEVLLSDEGVEALKAKGAHSRWHKVEDWSTDEPYNISTIQDCINNTADILNHEDFASLQSALNELDAIDGFIRGAENAMKEAFGDHTQVIVTAKGIETENYEHD